MSSYQLLTSINIREYKYLFYYYLCTLKWKWYIQVNGKQEGFIHFTRDNPLLR